MANDSEVVLVQEQDNQNENVAVSSNSDEMWSAVESGCNGSSRGGAGAGPAPCGRGKHSATLLAGYVYVLAGRGAGGSVPLRDFWRYSLATGRWERLECRGDPPPSLQEHSAIAHESKLYVFGGEAGTLSNETPLWIYDTETQIWRKLPGQSNYSATLRRRGTKDPRGAGVGPRGRRGHSAHALKDCLLIYGGYMDLKGSTHELWAFHYESESWHQVRTASPGPARHRHAAAMHDNRLYVHGGQCDLRECGDLTYYDTMSRSWRAVRGARAAPGARSGHAALRAGSHLYVFGGEAAGHATNELWRFHFATETWERIVQGLKWPSPRVDSCMVLVATAPLRVASAPASRLAGPRAGGAGARGRGEEAPGLLRELSRLSGLRVRRAAAAAAARCSYSVLSADTDADSTESLALPKSRSAYVIDKRHRADDDGHESPLEGDVPDYRTEVAREPISVPDFADMILPTPVLSPMEATKLVYLDSEDEEDVRREIENLRRRDGGPRTIVAIPKSASVRFTKETLVTDDEGESSTSDYASAERVNRLSGASLGFSNPHYLGPDVRSLGAALTPDSGVGPGDIELQDLGGAGGAPRRATRGSPLHLLLVGGKEPPHLALLQSRLSMWTYRLL